MKPSADPESMRARRYLLGQAVEEDQFALEQQFFAADDTLEHIAAVEEDLIEAYLDNELAPEEHELFQRHYLSAAHHRRRVDTIRELRLAAASAAETRTRIDADLAAARAAATRRRFLSVAIAAAVFLVAAATFWILNRRDGARVDEAPPSSARPIAPQETRPPAVERDERPAPRILAVSISPVATRSSGGGRILIIPTGTDVVAVGLEGDAGPYRRARATIETVTGDDVWQGPASAPDRAGLAARINVPAAVLRPDDYIVTLYGRSADGQEHERYRYFLPVGAR